MKRPIDIAYVERNIRLGRPPGLVRLRLKFRKKVGDWFNLLTFSPTDLMRLAEKENWRVKTIIPWWTIEQGYAVVMIKARSSD